MPSGAVFYHDLLEQHAKQNPLAVDEDFYLECKKWTDVSGSTHFEIARAAEQCAEDAEYAQTKLFRALGLPRQFQEMTVKESSSQ